MSYLCKYCYQRFNSKNLMVLRNCSESPTGKHSPSGSLRKGIYFLGFIIGIFIGIISSVKYIIETIILN